LKYALPILLEVVVIEFPQLRMIIAPGSFTWSAANICKHKHAGFSLKEFADEIYAVPELLSSGWNGRLCSRTNP
jgi:hypothetical protein